MAVLLAESAGKQPVRRGQSEVTRMQSAGLSIVWLPCNAARQIDESTVRNVMADGFKFNQWLQDTIFKPLEDKKMPVMEHLVELQVRLTRAVDHTAVVFVGTFFYADALVKWIRVPLQNMFVPGPLSWVPTDLPTVPFVFLAPAEALWQNVKVAGLFALVLANPVYSCVESLAVRRAGAARAGTAVCRAVCHFEHAGVLRRVVVFIFLRASVRAEFFDFLWRERRLHSADSRLRSMSDLPCGS